MKTLIEGGWVVGYNGTSHEVYERGSVVFEDDRIVHAGGQYTGPVDARLSARGKLVSPGFINTHVHTSGNGGDYLLLRSRHDPTQTVAVNVYYAVRMKGKKVELEAREEPREAKVIDLMERLRASLAETARSKPARRPQAKTSKRTASRKRPRHAA